MKIFIKSVALLLICALLFSFCGCGSNYSSQVIYAETDQKLFTIDPQLASTQSERMTVLNTFEGLLRINENNEIVNGVAKSYAVNGLTYTFNLRKDAVWSDGTPLTAADFVFGFRRAADPATNSPDYADIACIAGAPQVHDGSSDSSALAVAASDKYTLVITLAYAYADFLRILTQPIAMPCNEEFFRETSGKYGRSVETTLGNGSFRVSLWNTQDYLVKLRRNENYTGNFDAVPSAVYLTCGQEAERFDKLKSNAIDCSFISSSDIDRAKQEGFTVDSFYNRYWFLIINKSASLGNANIRKALAMSIHRNNLENNMKNYVKRLDTALPLICEKDGKMLYNDVKAGYTFTYEPFEAYKIYSDASAAVMGTSLKIVYPEDNSIRSIVSDIAEGWQQNLGCFINIEAVDSNASVENLISSGSYCVAMLGIDISSTDAAEFLKIFKAPNIYGFSDTQFDSTVDSLASVSGYDNYTKTLRIAENLLLSDNSVIPIAATATTICYSKALSDIHYSILNGSVDFSTVKKLEK